MNDVTTFIPRIAIACILFWLAGCVVDRGKPLAADEIEVYLTVVRDGGSDQFLISNEMLDAFGITQSEHMRSILPSAPDSAITDFLATTQKHLSWEKNDQRPIHCDRIARQG